jgi:hypothetical protein
VRATGPGVSWKCVLEMHERGEPGAADQSGGDPQPEEVVERSRDPDRAAGVLPDPHEPEVRGHSRSRACAGSAGISRRVVRVLRVAGDRRGGEPARSEVAERRLGEDHRACRPELRDDRRVGVRHVAVEHDRAEGRAQAGRLDLVLDEDRDPVQRPGELAPGGDERVPSGGVSARSGVHGHDSMQLCVVLLDPTEVPVDELDNGQLAAAQRSVERLDGELLVHRG